ncbi:MAG: tetratricopeptide repeat protein [Flavobacterium sp.]|uniref:tetratricopeptide repeat-containing sensor histidine kinase n=1 Tax=Flavobacterium sp. TaxID=239 RepID=UPI0012060F1C|nr:sensor histidine kinase [Flavobacterium sp.]RZJ66366.1 MAG: tetratricopeptide repeat protein [Flavobacterium sp.]
MRKLFAFALLSLIFYSCKEKQKQQSQDLSREQVKIKKEFNRLDEVYKQLPSDSMQSFSDRFKKLTANQPADYKAMSNIVEGAVFMSKSQYELSYKSFENALRLLRNSNADSLRARAYTGIGNYYKNKGNYPKAIEYLLGASKIYEAMDGKRGIATTNGNIGEVYMQKNDMALAKEHLRKAMNVFKNDKSHQTYLNAAHTLANVHGASNEFDEALAIDNECIRICDSIKSPKLKVPFLDNKALCYMFTGKLDSAQYYFNETLKIDLIVGDKKQIADTYSNLGHLELNKGNYAEAERYTLKSIDMVARIKNQSNLVKSYGILSDIYARWGKYDKALATKEEYLEQYKKLMNEKKEAAAAEFKIVHETEKKEKIIAQNRIQLLEKEREVHSRNNMIIGISLGALFIALTGFLIYRQQRLKNRQQAQEHELKTAIAQIETQNKLQEQRLGISRDLHDNIGAQLTFIISSVDNLRYAFDLKDTKLEKKLNSINDFTKDTIVELRDTIWAMNNAEISLEDLRVRVFNFIEKAKDVLEGIDFRFHIDKELQQLRFSSVTGMNIYRSIQEAVNNAIKYAKASRIGIFIEHENGELRIRIEDDGIGFSQETAQKGNGLHNIRKRIEDIGGTFTLVSEPGNGTHITVVIPKTTNPDAS